MSETIRSCMSLLLRYVLLFFTATMLCVAQVPKATGVLNAASYRGSLAPGALASLFGSNLASGRLSAQALPLPTQLGGTQVLIQDPSRPNPISAPLYFVSPGQINFQIPFEVVRPNISISVLTPQGTSNAITVNLSPMAPGIFSQTADGAGAALAFDPNFNLLTATPALGSTVIFYATGLGVTTPAAQSGVGGASSPPLNQVSAPFDVYIGGTKATVAWAGLAPGFSGVYQVNVVPSGEAIGDVFITCSTCSESNHVQMPQAALNTGTNTANVTGSITILYPANQPKVTYSAAAVVANVKAQFDVKPGATRFTLSVVATIGGAPADGTTIQFDPVTGQFTATVPSPTQAERQGDFSSLTDVLVMDFLSGLPFVRNIVPASRLDPNLLTAFQSVPLPNTPASGIHSSYTISGKVTPGSTSTFDGSTNVDLQNFASFGFISAPASDVPVKVTLLIDGQVVGIATATYKPPL
jgi:uncharacterized protein (TIGR03437 family)